METMWTHPRDDGQRLHLHRVFTTSLPLEEPSRLSRAPREVITRPRGHATSARRLKQEWYHMQSRSLIFSSIAPPRINIPQTVAKQKKSPRNKSEIVTARIRYSSPET